MHINNDNYYNFNLIKFKLHIYIKIYIYIIWILILSNLNMFKLFILIFFNKIYNYKLLFTQFILYIIINLLNNIKINYNNYKKLFIQFIQYIINLLSIKKNYNNYKKLFIQFIQYIINLLNIKKNYYNFKKLLFLIYNNLNKYKLKLNIYIYKLIDHINKVKINFIIKKKKIEKKIEELKFKYNWIWKFIYSFVYKLYKWKWFRLYRFIRLIIYIIKLLNNLLNIKKNYYNFKKLLILIYNKLNKYNLKLKNYFKNKKNKIKNFKHKYYWKLKSNYRLIHKMYNWRFFRSRQLTRRLRIRLKYPGRMYLKSVLLKTVRYPHTVRKLRNYRYLISSNKTRRRFKWVVRRRRIKIRFYDKGYITIILLKRIVAWFKSTRVILYNRFYIGRARLYRGLLSSRVKITLWKYLGILYGKRRRRKYKKLRRRLKVYQKLFNVHYKENFYRAVTIKSFYISFNTSINLRLNLKFIYIKNRILLYLLKFYTYKITIKNYYKNFCNNFYKLNLLLLLFNKFKKLFNKLIWQYFNYLLNFYIKIFLIINWCYQKIFSWFYYIWRLNFNKQNLDLGFYILSKFNFIQFKFQYYYISYTKYFIFKFILNIIMNFFKCIIIFYIWYFYYNFFWFINFFFNNFFFKLLISEFLLYKKIFIYNIIFLYNYNKNIYYR